MIPVDFRNATFEGLREGLEAKRQSVYAAFQVYGPGTTRHVAGEAGIDLLTLRPRVTELIEMGLVTLDECDEGGKEGVYRATTFPEWENIRRAVLADKAAREAAADRQQRLL